MAPLEQAGLSIHAVSIPEAGPWNVVPSAAMAALRARPFVMYARHEHKLVRAAIAQERDRLGPAIWYLDHLDAFVYADEVTSGKIVGDMHSVYSLLAAQTAGEHPRPTLRAYLAREARLLSEAEADAAKRADLLLTVSDAERGVFAALGAREVAVAPNGVDVERFSVIECANRPAPPTILYIGAMSWAPNAIGAEFLAREVMPILRNRVPGVRLCLVGRDPTPAVRALAGKDVVVAGNVPDIAEHFRAAHVLAVPLETGGGTRIKILEAFAAGLPVVSTPVGCEGLMVEHERELVVAPLESFADALADILTSPDRARLLAERARERVRQFYDWRTIGAGVERRVVALAADKGVEGDSA